MVKATRDPAFDAYPIQRVWLKVATSARSLVVAAGILLTILGVGALMGCMGVLWAQGGFAPGEAVHLT